MKSKRTKLPPLHPGKILREDFLNPRARCTCPRIMFPASSTKSAASVRRSRCGSHDISARPPSCGSACNRITNWIWPGTPPRRRSRLRYFRESPVTASENTFAPRIQCGAAIVPRLPHHPMPLLRQKGRRVQSRLPMEKRCAAFHRQQPGLKNPAAGDTGLPEPLQGLPATP